MKAKVTFEEKRRFVFNLLCSKDRAKLASLLISMMYKKDIEQIYKDKDV